MKQLTMTDSTVEKAVAKGLIKLNASKDQVEIKVLEPGKKGLFGFGAKNAVVELTLKEVVEETASPSTEAAPAVQEPVQAAGQAKALEVVEDKLQASEEQAKADAEVAATKEPGAVSANKAEASSVPSQAKTSGRFESVSDYLQEVMAAYGAQTTITIKETSKKILFQIDSPKVGLLIGKHGKIINALQVLAQTLVYRIDEKAPMVILNIGDYRQKREERLKEIADRTAKKVLKTKQAVFLEPLPAFERKIIHAKLSKYDHISTHSEGKEPYRYLVVDYAE